MDDVADVGDIDAYPKSASGRDYRCLVVVEPVEDGRLAILGAIVFITLEYIGKRLDGSN